MWKASGIVRRYKVRGLPSDSRGREKKSAIAMTGMEGQIMRYNDTTIPTAPPTTPAIPPTVPPGEVDVFLMEAGAKPLLRRSDTAVMGLLLVECGLLGGSWMHTLPQKRMRAGRRGRLFLAA
jgi:hypothetical protein